MPTFPKLLFIDHGGATSKTPCREAGAQCTCLYSVFCGAIFICFSVFFLSETMEKKLVEETKQLELDLNDERLRYQNLLNEFSRLEERYDDLKEEMTLMVVSQTFLLFLNEKF